MDNRAAWRELKEAYEDQLTPEQREYVSRVRAQRFIERFDPDQPRDELGKWTSDGGDGLGISSGGEFGIAPSTVGGGSGKPRAIASDFDAAGVEILESDQRRFVSSWNQRVGMSPAEFKQKFMGGMDGNMQVQFAVDDSLQVIGDLWDKDGEIIAQFDAYVEFDNKALDCGSLTFRNAEQGKGYAKQFILGQINTARELGMEKVKLLANADVGGYAWARYGAVPDQISWAQLLDRRDSDGLPERFNAVAAALNAPTADRVAMAKLMNSYDPKAIWAIADSKYGKDLLLGTGWSAEVELNDKDVTQRFMAYVAGKAKSKS